MRTRLVRRSVVSVASLTAALVFGACGDGLSLVDSAPPDLAGTTWVMTSASGNPAITAIEGTEVMITFEDGVVGVQAGCNDLLGAVYQQNDDVLEVEPMTSAVMPCDPPLMDRDAALAALLTSGPTVAGDADTLVIAGDGTTVELAARS